MKKNLILIIAILSYGAVSAQTKTAAEIAAIIKDQQHITATLAASPCDLEGGNCTIIDFNIANVVVSNNGQMLDFDIVTRDENNALTFSKGDVYIDYDAQTFGSNLVSGNYIMASKGSLIASPDYLMTLTDQAANTLKLSIDHVLNPTTLNTIGLVDQQLAHLTLFISSNGSTGNVAFDNGMMQGNTDYWDNNAATDQTYQVVNVGGAIQTPQSGSSLLYHIANETFSGGTYTFDITAQGGTEPVANAGILLTYTDPVLVFNLATGISTASWMSDSYSAADTLTSGPIYAVTTNSFIDGLGGHIYIQVDNVNIFDPSDGNVHHFPSSRSEKFATITLTIPNCGVGVPLSARGGIKFENTSYATAPITNMFAVLNAGGTTFTTSSYTFTDTDNLVGCPCSGYFKRASGGSCDDGINVVSADASSYEVYPVPFSSDFTLGMTITESENIRVYVTNTMGQNVYYENIGKFGQGKYTYPIKLPSYIDDGIYFLRITQGKKTITLKLIKQ